MEKIARKSLLYKTGVEYGDYTINHVFGCSHGCKYPCYAYQMAKRFGKINEYKEWISPRVVKNALELLEIEIPKLRDKIETVNMCFSTDPFMMNQKEIAALSMEIIRRLNEAGIACTVLTKGLLPKELAQMNKKNQYGISIITLDEQFRKDMEPGAAQIEERIQHLECLHKKGCKTWVSIEPYPTPNFIDQSLEDILNRISFVDKIIFGRMHYNKKVSEYEGYKDFYNQCAKNVIDFCDINKIDYHIKSGTVSKDRKKENE